LDKHKRDAIKQPWMIVHAHTSVCRRDERAALSGSYLRPASASTWTVDKLAGFSVKWRSYDQTIVVFVLTEGDSSCNLLLSLPVRIGTQGGGVNAILQG